MFWRNSGLKKQNTQIFGGQFWALGAKIVVVWDLRLWFPFGGSVFLFWGSGEKGLSISSQIRELPKVPKNGDSGGNNVAKYVLTNCE